MLNVLRRKWIKWAVIISVLLLISALISIYVANRLVRSQTIGKTFENVMEVPANKVGLLLGTAKYVSGNRINQYYKYRIEAAVELYNAGKIAFILVSGDNGTEKYDEPTAIKEDLIARGIPPSKIYLDYAGFRTLDSVVRCKEIFGQESITIISQKFHNERAIYIANHYGIRAEGYNARDVNKNYGMKTRLREHLARVKMLIDILIGKEPKFYGDKIEIK